MAVTNLVMFRGDTKVVQVTISGLGSGGLTGYTFWMTIKKLPTDLDAAAFIQKLTGTFTVTQVGNASTPGIITCNINPTDTSALPDNDTTLFYDVQVKDTSGYITTVASGTLLVTVDITKATS